MPGAGTGMLQITFTNTGQEFGLLCKTQHKTLAPSQPNKMGRIK